MRKILAIILTCSLCLCCNISVQAERILPQASLSNPEIAPLMEYITKYHANISVDEYGTATITSTIYGKPGVTTKTAISAELQRFVNGQWTTIKFFTVASMSHYAHLQHTYPLVSGYSYRIRATVTAYADGGAESYLAISQAVMLS